jgi:cell division protein FtsN
MHTIVEGTNLWQSSRSLDLSVLVLIAFAVIISFVGAGIIVVKYRKKKAQ